VPRWRNCDWHSPKRTIENILRDGTGQGVRNHFLIAERRRANFPTCGSPTNSSLSQPSPPLTSDSDGPGRR